MGLRWRLSKFLKRRYNASAGLQLSLAAVNTPTGEECRDREGGNATEKIERTKGAAQRQTQTRTHLTRAGGRTDARGTDGGARSRAQECGNKLFLFGRKRPQEQPRTTRSPRFGCRATRVALPPGSFSYKPVPLPTPRTASKSRSHCSLGAAHTVATTDRSGYTSIAAEPTTVPLKVRVRFPVTALAFLMEAKRKTYTGVSFFLQSTLMPFGQSYNHTQTFLRLRCLQTTLNRKSELSGSSFRVKLPVA